MQIKDNGSTVTIRLDKTNVSRMLDAVYLGRRIARNTEDKELFAACELIYAAVKKYGGHHLDDRGELKATESRPKPDESEATKGTVAP